MTTSSVHSKLSRTVASAALAAVATAAVLFAPVSQARPMYVNDGVFIQAPQLVVSPPQVLITPPHLAVNAVVVAPAPPVYVHPVRPPHVRPVVVYPPVAYPPAYVASYPVNYRPGRVYYIQGRPYLNGHPYHGYKRHHGYDRHHEYERHHGYDRHHDRHEGRHDEGRHSGWNR